MKNAGAMADGYVALMHIVHCSFAQFIKVCIASEGQSHSHVIAINYYGRLSMFSVFSLFNLNSKDWTIISTILLRQSTWEGNNTLCKAFPVWNFPYLLWSLNLSWNWSWNVYYKKQYHPIEYYRMPQLYSIMLWFNEIVSKVEN